MFFNILKDTALRNEKNRKQEKKKKENLNWSMSLGIKDNYCFVETIFQIVNFKEAKRDKQKIEETEREREREREKKKESANLPDQT